MTVAVARRVSGKKIETAKPPCPVGKPAFTLSMWPCAERKP